METRKLLTQFGVTAAAVLVVLLGFHLYSRWVIGRHMNAAYITEGLVIANSVKVRLLEDYNEWGEWATSNEEAGLPEPWEFAGQALESLTVSAGGVITLRFNRRSGVKGGIIELWPDDNPVSTRWNCTTPSFKRIEKLIPTCRYEKTGGG